MPHTPPDTTKAMPQTLTLTLRSVFMKRPKSPIESAADCEGGRRNSVSLTEGGGVRKEGVRGLERWRGGRFDFEAAGEVACSPGWQALVNLMWRVGGRAKVARSRSSSPSNCLKRDGGRC